jgi:anaerobic ribonucleoside-triphosphate reductase activating protein
MLLHGFVPISRANGPGRRAVIWFQGCSLHCPGCFNSKTHAFEGVPTDNTEIVERVLALHETGEIEGATFSGGEPMQQAQSLLELLKTLRADRPTPRLSFGMFTGYTLPELNAGRYFTFEDCRDKLQLWREIRKRLDFAVAGRYNRHIPATLPLRSSGNQQLHLFSERYRETDFQEQIVEVSIGEDGAATVTGFPVLGVPA